MKWNYVRFLFLDRFIFLAFQCSRPTVQKYLIEVKIEKYNCTSSQVNVGEKFGSEDLDFWEKYATLVQFFHALIYGQSTRYGNSWYDFLHLASVVEVEKLWEDYKTGTNWGVFWVIYINDLDLLILDIIF